MIGPTPPQADPRNLPTLPPRPTGPDSGSRLTITTPRKAEEAVATPVPAEFGDDYELLEELARGGMGVVYKARQKSLNRIVALKMILPGRLTSAEDLERFRREAEATARLQHPNIVAVHEVGEFQGQHFYSMDYIDGPSLAKRLQQGPFPNRVAARYVMLIARAIDHVHRHGILHRDLKPSNILLDSDDEPHITDFGLAKKIGGDSTQTRAGVVMGTPSYMAPEQAAGKIQELGPACDVYGLGAVLYELLTGRPPFRSESPLDTVVHVLEKEPAPPRLLNPKIERDLETICLKCLEKSPSHRYKSAEALAEDLERFLKGESVQARPFNMIDRLARTLERSHHAAEFHSWGTMLFIFGGIVLMGHLLIFWLLETEQPKLLLWCARLGQFALMALIFLRFRGWENLLPTSTAERQLWSIWLGYVTAYLISALIGRELLSHGQRLDEWTLYPFTAVLTGLAFFIMGSNYWGRCYAIGLAFFGLAVLMPLNLDWAPLEFGILWSITFTSLGIHLHQIGGQSGIDLEEELTVPVIAPRTPAASGSSAKRLTASTSSPNPSGPAGQH
jgi:eukaryotic-like serine/threonine-protein kinase